MVARRRKTGKEWKCGLIPGFKTWSAYFFESLLGYKKQHYSSAAFESEMKSRMKTLVGWRNVHVITARGLLMLHFCNIPPYFFHIQVTVPSKHAPIPHHITSHHIIAMPEKQPAPSISLPKQSSTTFHFAMWNLPLMCPHPPWPAHPACE